MYLVSTSVEHNNMWNGILLLQQQQLSLTECSFAHVDQCLPSAHFLSNVYLNQEVLLCALAN